MHIEVTIDNVYDDGTVTTHEVADVPAPTGDIDAWAEEHLYYLTGTGRTSGDAGYFLKVIACEIPELVGREFEWGV